MMTSNPFEQLAERQARKTRPVKTAEQIEQAHKYRVANAKYEKEERDQQRQFKLYLRWRRQQRKELLQNNNGLALASLLKMLKKLGTTVDADMLVALVSGAEWLKGSSEEVRLKVLSYIDDAIIRYRVQHGLPPFDDALMDEEPTAFLKIRKELMGV